MEVIPGVNSPASNVPGPNRLNGCHSWHTWALAEEKTLRVKTLRGSGCDRLLPAVPVTQYRKKKDGRHAGQSASDKENAVGMNEAVRGAQTFDLSARKPLQYLSQPGIG